MKNILLSLYLIFLSNIIQSHNLVLNSKGLPPFIIGNEFQYGNVKDIVTELDKDEKVAAKYSWALLNERNKYYLLSDKIKIVNLDDKNNVIIAVNKKGIVTEVIMDCISRDKIAIKDSLIRIFGINDIESNTEIAGETIQKSSIWFLKEKILVMRESSQISIRLFLSEDRIY